MNADLDQPNSSDSVLREPLALTIVIVNWNGGEKLLSCLRSILTSQTSFPVRVIVVDNNSQDGSREQAAGEFPEFRVLNTGANLGFGRGNNFARPWVETPLVLFLNPDTELFPDTLEKAVRSLVSRPHVGLLGCQMRYPDGAVQELGLQWFPTPGRVFWELSIPGLLRRKPLARWVPQQDPVRSGSVQKLYGGFLLARKAVLDAAGWFDERYFMYAEDVDLSRTVRDLGWDLYYEAECAVIHACGAASEKAPGGFSILMKQRSINRLIEKYQGPRAARRLRRAVCLASGLRLLGLWLLRKLSAVTGAESRPLDHAWQRSVLLWQWACRGREAEVPDQPRNARIFPSDPKPAPAEAP